MKIFNQKPIDHLTLPLFFGDGRGVARYETYKHSVINQLIEKQLSFRWRETEIDVSKDAIDFNTKLSPSDQFKFTENLKYQTLLDTVQGRAPVIAFSDIVSDISLENWIVEWTESESIHSRSYTHIMRNVFLDPSKEFDDIVLNDAIMKRATAVTKYYDELIKWKRIWQVFPEPEILHKLKKCLYLCMHAVNALEAIRFYVSFAVSWNFAEHGLMEGNAKIIKLIARDEQLHLKGTQYIIRQWQMGEDDPEMAEIAKECQEEAEKLFLDAANQEKEWIDHLFSEGDTLGLTADILYQFVDYLTDSRMRSAGLRSPFQSGLKHPIPWIQKWLNSENVQVARQEAEESSYLLNNLNMKIDEHDLDSLSIK